MRFPLYTIAALVGVNVTEPLVAPVADAVIVAEVIALPLYDIASSAA